MKAWGHLTNAVLPADLNTLELKGQSIFAVLFVDQVNGYEVIYFSDQADAQIDLPALASARAVQLAAANEALPPIVTDPIVPS